MEVPQNRDQVFRDTNLEFKILEFMIEPMRHRCIDNKPQPPEQ